MDQSVAGESQSMSHPILLVCESLYDFDICAHYIDRTIVEYGPDWAIGNLDAARAYIGIDPASDVPLETFVRWGHIVKVTNKLTETIYATQSHR